MEGTNHDLQSILSELARFAPPVQTTYPTGSQESTYTPEYVPLEQTEPTSPPQPFVEQAVDPRLKPQSRATAPAQLIDPATITTWQDGLRCVTKIAAQNAQFAASIRKMMDDQRKHEMRWYSERQALKQTQAKRSFSSAQAQSILQSLGSTNQTIATGAEAIANSDIELAAFDRKIYDAQQEMETAMTAELKDLGVPFFGTDGNLVVPNDSKLPGKIRQGQRPKWSPVVNERQLLELRRRMVGHLEDLYRD